MSEHENELSALIQSKATRHTAPAQLRAVISTMLAQESRGVTAGHRPEMTGRRQAWNSRRWIEMAAACAAGMLASFALVLIVRGSANEDRLVQAVVDNHVRSLMSAHLVDVKSSDKHTVKPWFSGKIDYAPTVKNIQMEGIELVGGRLEYLNQRPVAAVVYRLNQHVINVFAWPAAGGAAREPVFSVHQGFNVAHWISGGMQNWAISDLNPGDLRNIVRLLASADG